jgi:hypothetical protein
MTNNARIASETYDASNVISPITRQISALLSASAAGLVAVGIVTGLISYLHRSPVRAAHVPGMSAWPQHLIVAAVACGLYGVARWRHGRRAGRGSGRGRDGLPLPGRRADDRGLRLAAGLDPAPGDRGRSR